jgi:hypothetical protein
MQIMLLQFLAQFINNQTIPQQSPPSPPPPPRHYLLLTPDQIDSIVVLTLSLVSTVIILWVLWNTARCLPWIGWFVWWLFRKALACILFVLGLLRDISYLATGLLFCIAVGFLAWITLQTDLVNLLGNINLSALQPFLSGLETVFISIFRSILTK